MNFSHFVKLGGHAFSLLQNKDLLELYGMANKGYKQYKEQQKKQPNNQASASAPTSVQVPQSYPAPIDSPYWGGYPGSQRPPMYPSSFSGWGYPPGNYGPLPQQRPRNNWPY